MPAALKTVLWATPTGLVAAAWFWAIISANTNFAFSFPIFVALHGLFFYSLIPLIHLTLPKEGRLWGYFPGLLLLFAVGTFLILKAVRGLS